MTLSAEFKIVAQEGVDQFLEQFTASSNELIHTEQGVLSEHPQDFNLGSALGFLEGSISVVFTNMNKKQMTQEENLEIRKMISKIAPKIKQLIFDAQHR